MCQKFWILTLIPRELSRVKVDLNVNVMLVDNRGTEFSGLIHDQNDHHLNGHDIDVDSEMTDREVPILRLCPTSVLTQAFVGTWLSICT